MRLRKSRKRAEAPQKEEKPFFSQTGKEPGVQTKDEGFFQPKLAIGKPGDRFEQEADRMADAVTNRSRSADDATAIRKKKKLQRQEEEEEAMQPKLQRQAEEEEEPQAKLQRQAEEEEEPQAKLQRQAEEEEEPQAKLQRQAEEEEEPQAKLQLQEEEEEAQPKLQLQEEEEEAQAKLQRQEEEEEEPVQTQAEEEEEGAAVQAQSQKKQARSPLSQRLAENKGKGHPLSPAVRKKMEAAFETDFSEVRIHTDPEAVQMSEELGAQAFTHGHDIYFNEGMYNPSSGSGERLLAHELTHVVQQNKK